MIRNICLSIICTVLIISVAIAAALGIILSTNFIYAYDINALDIEESSGMSRDEIIDNVDAMMDYLSPFSDEDFSLPSLAWTQEGASHFADCKVIFNLVLGSGVVSLALLCTLIVVFRRRSVWLRNAGVAAALLPLLLGGLVSLDFDLSFEIFHSLFFAEGTWLFNIYTDPIINILPERYFAHCAAFMIIMCVVLGGTTFIVATVRIKKQRTAKKTQ